MISDGLELTVKDFLFEPDAPCMDHEGLLIPDAIVGQDKNRETTLVIANSSCMPVLLEEGELVVKLQGCEVFQPNMPPSDINTKTVDAVQSRPLIDQDHLEKLQTELQLSSLDLTPAESYQISLLTEFAELFALDSTELGRISLLTYRIDTRDSPPIKQAPRRLPFALRHHTSKLVDEMLTRVVITPSSSPWASPLALVTKSDGSRRFCVDYHCVNAVTKQNVYPLPRIDDSLDLLSWSC